MSIQISLEVHFKEEFLDKFKEGVNRICKVCPNNHLGYGKQAFCSECGGKFEVKEVTLKQPLSSTKLIEVTRENFPGIEKCGIFHYYSGSSTYVTLELGSLDPYSSLEVMKHTLDSCMAEVDRIKAMLSGNSAIEKIEVSTYEEGN